MNRLPVSANNGDITDFNEGNTTISNSFKVKEKVTDQTGNNGTKIAEIMVSINMSEKCVIVATNVEAQPTTFSTTDTRLYAPVLTLSTQDNAKLLEQLKSGFKRTSNWNKYQPKVSTERPNQYLDF